MSRTKILKISKYEKVKILRCEDYPEYVGKYGHATFIQFSDESEICYVEVEFSIENGIGDDYLDGCDFPIEDIEWTGDVISSEDYNNLVYGNDPVFIKVSVDENGEGNLLE
ncbi:MAG: hypothetical protein HC843_13375 [Sphingomonadales bacterium]|nr:hypothetical protein [Sphingomonadales bacterium]